VTSGRRDDELRATSWPLPAIRGPTNTGLALRTVVQNRALS
jgi:hypothetical protein